MTAENNTPAFTAGYHARSAGKTMADNPHELGTLNHLQWRRGFRANEPKITSVQENTEKKTFAMALNIACAGGEWAKANVDFDSSPEVHVFDGRFPSEKVEARVVIDKKAKTYQLMAWKNNDRVIDDVFDYTTISAIPVKVAFELSQRAFGALNEGLAVGDQVEVDGEEAVVSDPDAPGDTVAVKIDGVETMADKKSVKLDENAFMMATIPSLKRIAELAGVSSSQDVSFADAAKRLKDVSAGFDFSFNQNDVSSGEQSVEDGNPAIVSPDEECDWAEKATCAVACLEEIMPNLTVIEYRELAPRIQNLMNIIIAEMAAPRRPKI